MEAGKLRHPITLQAPQRTKDIEAGVVIVWINVADVWAEVVPIAAAEQWIMDRATPTTSHRVRMRYRSDVDAGMRILHAGRVLEVETAIDTDERTRELICLCRETNAVA